MKCPGCRFDNPADMQFCGRCGSKLERICSGCSFANPSGFEFCGKCGNRLKEILETSPVDYSQPKSYTPKHLADKILQSKSVLEGERKQVTVLFADVKGSMELAEQVDPEEWHRILDRFFQILADGVHRFEGTINQYTGDGIMALFGAPIAHEDHAQRACYAALHLREELRRYADELRRGGLNFSTRMGLNSGEVVVGKIGDDLRMDYTAQGQTVGLAQRLEQRAAPDTAYLSASTARLIEGFFKLRDLGEFDLKGMATPVRAYELVAAGPIWTRLQAARSRGLSRFVGRVDEMAILELALHRATEGNGQVVGIVGEAGVGKSRLCLEFLEGCRAKGVRVFEAHCPAHGRAIPLLPFLEMLRDLLGVSGRDQAQQVREAIAGRLILLDREFEATLPLVFEFLGVPDPEHLAPALDPEVRQRQLFTFTRRLVAAMSAQEPLVLLVDDLQWIDPASDGFLDQIADAVGDSHALLLVNFRPEYEASWMRRPHYQQVPLLPLGPEEIEELLRRLLGRDPSVAPLMERIGARTGGNPFFIEEVVQSLAEVGSLEGVQGEYRLTAPVEEVAVPASVQAVLAARIDRLPEREKQLLQTAAVIGKEFAEQVLENTAKLPREELANALAVLRDGGFIREQALYPVVEYAFKHPLTQEVALNSQLRERRARVHAAVARAIEKVSGNRIDEEAALLAHHWEQAGDALEASRWHSRAADSVFRRDSSQAFVHWQRMISLLESLDQEEEVAQLDAHARISALTFGVGVGLLPDAAERIFTQGIELTERRKDLRSSILMRASYAQARVAAGGGAEMGEFAAETIRMAESLDDLEVKLGTMHPLAFALMVTGRIVEGLRLVDRLGPFAANHPDLGIETSSMRPICAAVAWRATILAYRGRLEDASAARRLAISLARQYGDMRSLVWMHHTGAEHADLIGREVDLAEALLAVELSDEIGSVYWQGLCLIVLGKAQRGAADLSTARSQLEHGCDLLRSIAHWHEAWGLLNLSQVWLDLGEPKRARAIAEHAVAIAEQRASRLDEPRAQLVLARVLLQGADIDSPEAAACAIRVGLSVAEDIGFLAMIPLFLVERANLSRLRGEEAALEYDLREAHRMFTEMGATGHAQRLAKELGI